MRSRSAVSRLKRAYGARSFGLALTALSLLRCASPELPLPPRPDAGLLRSAPARPAGPATSTHVAPRPSARLEPPAAALPEAPATALPEVPAAALPEPPPPEAERCAGVPPLGPNGAVPPAPPHTPLGEDLAVPGDRPVYVLQGNPGDSRVIVYLHGMCGDVTAADYFREAVRAHGTLIALRGDTACRADRFKWRADPASIQARVRAALKRVNAARGGDLVLQPALLIGYSQGADRAEKLAQRYPVQYPRVVLGGPPLKPSPLRLGRAERVAILGGERETTDKMRAGYDALQAAGITSRFITLECAYHGYFGINAEAQLRDVLDWLREP